MKTDPFRITIHMVSSVDGYIAKKDNSMAWFETADQYEKGVTGQDPEEFLRSIDCYVMGARTYELALELSREHGWAYGDKPTIVLTHRPLTDERPHISFYSGDLHTLVNEQLKPRYQNVWVVGGANLTKAFLQLQLAHEIRVSLLPILLGDGLPYFDRIGREQTLHLKETTAYTNGMVEICYEIVPQ